MTIRQWCFMQTDRETWRR